MDGLKLRYDILCVRCGTEITRIRPHKLSKGEIIGYEEWYYNENGNPLCYDCYDHARKKRMIRFQDERINVGIDPRTGYCSKCSNNIFDGSCLVTGMHHKKYDRNNPLRYTVELCSSCHAYETLGNKRFIRNQYGLFKRKKFGAGNKT